MKILTFFQTLRGKLILTYTLVTVLALLVLEILALVVVFAFSGGTSSGTQAYLSDVLFVLPPQARPYLQPGARDLAGLNAWLQSTYQDGYASLPPQSTFDNPAAPIVKDQPIYVLAPDLTILAAAPASANDMVGRKYTPPANVSRGLDVLTRAQQLDLLSGELSARQPDGNYLMAVPVRQGLGSGPLAGIIILTVKAPPAGIGERLSSLLWIVPGTALVLLFAVAPLAALFGWIMSRGLTRRLRALTQAADAWSEGDFSVQPQDRAGDEISYLGGRMRRMAERIQTLLQTQQALALMEERNRLARELHDTVKQESFATLMQVRAAKNLLERDPAAARERLEQAEELIKTSQQELGTLITELRPTALEGQGLAAALGDILTAWSQQARIPVDFQLQNERRLPLETEQALFRVAQEALSNVARHSRASAASLRLFFEPGQVSLYVADNGTGFDPSVSTGGFGLESMRERMAALGGSLSIRSEPERGTIVTACAPDSRQEGA
jgi:two-component system, NarL family, sensor histidine kinase LiaS